MTHFYKTVRFVTWCIFRFLSNQLSRDFVFPAISALLGLFMLNLVFGQVLNNEYPSGMLRWILLVFGSLSAAGISAFITGTIQVKGSAPNLSVTATGSFAVYIVTMWLGSSWTSSSQYIALSANEINERIGGKTIIYRTGTHEFHDVSNNSTEIYRATVSNNSPRKHQKGSWFVSNEGTRGRIQYMYSDGNGLKTTCVSSILYNAANDVYITHQIIGTCGSREFSIADGNTAAEVASKSKYIYDIGQIIAKLNNMSAGIEDST